MTLLNYTDPVPVPAALTSGSGVQSYIDPTGDTWVAANGVKGGNWYRARDVLKSRVYRSAAYTLPTAASVTMIYDTANKDDYTLYNTSTGVITIPVTGWYRFTAQLQCGSQAAGSYLQISIVAVGTTFAQDTMYVYGTGVFQTVRINDLLFFNPGTTVVFSSRASTAVTTITGNSTNIATIEWVGSG